MRVEEHYDTDIHTQTITATMTKAEWLLIQRACVHFRLSGVASEWAEHALSRMFQKKAPEEYWKLTKGDFAEMGRW